MSSDETPVLEPAILTLNQRPLILEVIVEGCKTPFPFLSHAKIRTPALGGTLKYFG
jgi:hypothetical protein